MGTAGHEAEVWDEIAQRGTHIGHGVVIRFYSRGGQTAGLLLYHRHRDGAVCGGGVPFDIEANRGDGRPLWKVGPGPLLNLSPSIADNQCSEGLHGHIVDGLWVPC